MVSIGGFIGVRWVPDKRQPMEEAMDSRYFFRVDDAVRGLAEGECGFRVGNETRRVKAVDLMFIPRDTVHGPIVDSGRVALLSVFAPFFDRTKKNIRWSRDAFA